MTPAITASRSPLRYEPQILGTGGAIKNVADFWDDQAFLVVNADIVAEVDLADIYRAHCRDHPAGTLVLCDNPEFNSVAVEQGQWVTGFGHSSGGHGRPPGLFTFTGIQVLEPEILDYIPANTPYSSIDAFRAMLADGRKIKAVMIPKTCWQDIGSPERYRRAAVDKSVPRAFAAAFAAPCGREVRPAEAQRRRLAAAMVPADIRARIPDYGRPRYPANPGRPVKPKHSFSWGGIFTVRGCRCRKFISYDTFSGLVFLEDLGDAAPAAGCSINSRPGAADPAVPRPSLIK